MSIPDKLQIIDTKYRNKFKSIYFSEGNAAPLYDTQGGMFDIVLKNNLSPFDGVDRWHYSCMKDKFKSELGMMYTRTARYCVEWWYLNDETISRAMKLLDSFNLVDVKTVDFIIPHTSLKDDNDQYWVSFILRIPNEVMI